MSKSRPLTQQKVIRVLKKNGFEKVRVKLHITFKKKIDGKTLTTFVPKKHKEISAGVVLSIIKNTGIPREEFFGK